MKQPVVLKIFKGEALEAVRQFGQTQIVIGSTSDAQLELKDEGVALLHAMIEDREGEYVLSDLGSATGTFLNGNRVLENRLSAGDEVVIGAYRLQFFIGVPKPAAPPRASGETGSMPIQPPRAMNFTSESLGAAPAPRDPAPAAPASAPAAEDEDLEPTAVLELSEDMLSSNADVASEPPAIPATPPAAAFVARAPVVKKSKPAPAAVEVPKTKPTPPKATSSPGPAPASASAAGSKAGSADHGPGRRKKTFAPPSSFGNVGNIIKPGKGNVVEVLVTWNNKILSSNHFNRRGSVFLSSDETADVVVPILSATSKYELVKMQEQVTICLTQEMTGEVTREGGESVSFAELSRQNRIRNASTHFELDLRQGEAVRIGLQNELISIFVRFKPQAPPVGLAPLIDMTSSEVTGTLLALLVSVIMGSYMSLVTPSQLLDDEARQEQPVRWAVVKFKAPPRPKEEPPPVEIPPTPVEKKVVQVTEKKAETKQVTQVKQQAAKPAETKSGDSGKAGEPAPNPNAKPNPNKVASSKPGGAVKTGAKEGANMQSEKQDVAKTGLLGAFASKGTRKTLDKAYSGSGELQGMAESATGVAGSSETRAGDSFGTKLKDATSGKGSSTVGIAGVGTQGRGTGTTGYGTGGIGQRGSVQINIEGQEGAQTGGMDREAIRRVIRDHLREIRSCYERELKKAPDLYGKLSLQWDIEEGGRVGAVEVKINALGNANVANCIASRLKTWKFPDPPKDQIGRVVYPFVFSSQ